MGLNLPRQLIAVVTISKANSAGLERTLRSIDEQTFGSIQNVVQIAVDEEESRALEIRHARPGRSFHFENDKGIYDGMNLALAKVDAELVMYLNAGDVFASPSVVEIVYSSWQREGWTWAYGAVHHGGESTAAYIYPHRRVSNKRVSLGWDSYPHPACVYETKLLRELGPYRTDIGNPADQELCLRARTRSEPWWIPHVLVTFEGGGASSGNSSMAHELEFHKLRRATGGVLGGSLLMDASWTRVSAGLRGLDIWRRRLLRSFRG